MRTTNVLSVLRRSPAVVDCFRNARLYRKGEMGGMLAPPQMVVLFTWLGAKQKYAHKYASCWNNRGYDVLHVTTSVRDLLMPKTGAEVTASRVVDFINNEQRQVIVHGLSVGGYLTQLVLLMAQDSSISVSHQIFDSFTNVCGLKAGVENAVHPRYRSIARASAKIYNKYADLSSINRAQHFAMNSPCPSPAMFIHSMADQVTSINDIQPIISAAQKAGPVDTYFVPEEERIPHVTIMRYIGEQKYFGLIQAFLDKYRGTVLAGNHTDAQSSSVASPGIPPLATLSQ